MNISVDTAAAGGVVDVVVGVVAGVVVASSVWLAGKREMENNFHSS